MESHPEKTDSSESISEKVTETTNLLSEHVEENINIKIVPVTYSLPVIKRKHSTSSIDSLTIVPEVSCEKVTLEYEQNKSEENATKLCLLKNQENNNNKNHITETDSLEKASSDSVNFKQIETKVPIIENGSKKDLKDVKKKGWQTYMGLVLTLVSGFCFASLGLIVKYLKTQHVLNLGFFRFLGMLLPSIPFLLYAKFWQKQSLLKSMWPLTQPQNLKTFLVLFGRAFVGFGAVMCHFLSIQHMPLADAIVIGSCSSVFVAFAAHLFLGEKCGIVPILTAVLTVCGVAIISRPPILTGHDHYDVNLLIGAGFALSRMTLTSVAIVFIRYLRGVHAAVVVSTIGVLQLIQTTSLALVFNVFELPTDSFELLLCVALGLLSFASQMTLTLALKCEQAGPFAIVRSSSDTLCAFLLQFLVLGMVPDLYSLIGAAVVLSAVFLTVFRKWLISLPEDDQSRIRYSFL